MMCKCTRNKIPEERQRILESMGAEMRCTGCAEEAEKSETKDHPKKHLRLFPIVAAKAQAQLANPS